MEKERKVIEEAIEVVITTPGANFVSQNVRGNDVEIPFQFPASFWQSWENWWWQEESRMRYQ